jgi:hypothetical protein
MTRPILILFLARLALCADAPPAVFAFSTDSLTATITPLGGKPPSAPDSLFAALPCDTTSAADGPVAWFEVEVIDKRSGADLRFPLDENALRRGLRVFCKEEGAPPPARVAAQLRVMASRLRVRMRGAEDGSGK